MPRKASQLLNFKSLKDSIKWVFCCIPMSGMSILIYIITNLGAKPNNHLQQTSQMKKIHLHCFLTAII